jgi:hypothetical protein
MPGAWRPAVPHGRAAHGRRADAGGSAAAARGEKRGFIFPIRRMSQHDAHRLISRMVSRLAMRL